MARQEMSDLLKTLRKLGGRYVKHGTVANLSVTQFGICLRWLWMYLYRAIDRNGDTVEFWFSERRNLTAAKRLLRKALKRHGRPERIVIDGSQTNRERSSPAILPISSRIEQGVI